MISGYARTAGETITPPFIHALSRPACDKVDANPVTLIATSASAAGGTPNWIDPTYDAAGNMTLRPDPADPADAGDQDTIRYNAWNQVVQIIDATSGSVVTYEYGTFDSAGGRGSVRDAPNRVR